MYVIIIIYWKKTSEQITTNAGTFGVDKAEDATIRTFRIQAILRQIAVTSTLFTYKDIQRRIGAARERRTAGDVVESRFNQPVALRRSDNAPRYHGARTHATVLQRPRRHLRNASVRYTDVVTRGQRVIFFGNDDDDGMDHGGTRGHGEQAAAFDRRPCCCIRHQRCVIVLLLLRVGFAFTSRQSLSYATASSAGK